MITLDTVIFQFSLFSIVGWLIEVTYRSIEKRTFVNPGFNWGPYLPLYGTGAVCLTLSSLLLGDIPLVWRSLINIAALTLMEYLTGEMLLLVFKRRCWDYRDNRYNLRGHICLSFSLAWIGVALTYEFLLYPGALLIQQHCSPLTVQVINITFLLILTIDFFFSSELKLRTTESGIKMRTWCQERIQNLIAIDFEPFISGFTEGTGTLRQSIGNKKNFIKKTGNQDHES